MMTETDNPNLTEKLTKDLVSYVNLRVNAAKLAVVENLSEIFCDGFGLLFGLALGMIALVLFSAALTLWLGVVTGSFLLACLLVGVFFLLLAMIFFALRRRMFADRMVAMFSKMFFSNRKENEDDRL